MRYAKYDGINGIMHGENIDKIPAVKAMPIVKFILLYYQRFFIFARMMTRVISKIIDINVVVRI